MTLSLALGACSSKSDDNNGPAGPLTPPHLDVIALESHRFQPDPAKTWIKTEQQNIHADVIIDTYSYKRTDEICNKLNDPAVVTVAKSFDPRFLKNSSRKHSSRAESRRVDGVIINDTTEYDVLGDANAGTFMRTSTAHEFRVSSFPGSILKEGYSFPITMQPIPYQRTVKLKDSYLSIEDDSTLSEEQQSQMFLTYANPQFLDWLKNQSSSVSPVQNCKSSYTNGSDWTASYQEVSYGTYRLDNGVAIPALKVITSYKFTQTCDNQPANTQTNQLLEIKSLKAVGENIREYCSGVKLLSISNFVGGFNPHSSKTEVRDISHEL